MNNLQDKECSWCSRCEKAHFDNEPHDETLNIWLHEVVLGKCWHIWKWPEGWDYTQRICEICSEYIDPHPTIGEQRIPVFNWMIPDNPDYCGSRDAVAEVEKVVISKYGEDKYHFALKYELLAVSVVTPVKMIVAEPIHRAKACKMVVEENEESNT